mmetsp:Transcript_37709/g.105027  ORF Transcript_37709/g.105027 Transcript_37709/m.105027 type:complete len:225 (+) Transcript_37709:176-850(+)
MCVARPVVARHGTPGAWGTTFPSGGPSGDLRGAPSCTEAAGPGALRREGGRSAACTPARSPMLDAGARAAFAHNASTQGWPDPAAAAGTVAGTAAAAATGITAIPAGTAACTDAASTADAGTSVSAACIAMFKFFADPLFRTQLMIAPAMEETLGLVRRRATLNAASMSRARRATPDSTKPPFLRDRAAMQQLIAKRRDQQEGLHGVLTGRAKAKQGTMQKCNR